MLAFIDESGHPHPNDPCQRPVVVSVCLDETDGRSIAARIHALKRDLLGQERMELKANNLINRHTFRRKPQFVSFLEEFYNTLLNLPVTIFAMIMEKPFENRQIDEDYLPNRFRFLVQRIELLAEERNSMATIMFDGSAGLYGGLGWQFNGYLYRSEEGRAFRHITDVPSFVDSRTSPGIQIADMVASVIRQFEEAELYKQAPQVGDVYLYTIRRWYNIIRQKTRDDLTTIDGYSRPGFYRLAAGDS